MDAAFLGLLVGLALAGETVSQRGDWLVVQSDSFRVSSRIGRDESLRIVRRCELLRRQLREKLSIQLVPERWSPRAEIVIHRTDEELAGALGITGAGPIPAASTLLTFAGERVVGRRIDLRANAANLLDSVLPHELTHVAAGDCCGGRPLPRWADEGLAILSESAWEREARSRLANEAARRGRGVSLPELLGQRDFFPADRRDAFYARSAALVAALWERGGPERFFQFIERARRDGYERAAQAVYGLDGLEAVNRLLAEVERRGLDNRMQPD